VEFAAGVDRGSYRNFGADWLQVVVAELRAQQEVASPGADRFGLPFNVPVDLTPHDHPPLVEFRMPVRPVAAARTVGNQRHELTLILDHAPRPGRLAETSRANLEAKRWRAECLEWRRRYKVKTTIIGNDE